MNSLHKGNNVTTKKEESKYVIIRQRSLNVILACIPSTITEEYKDAVADLFLAYLNGLVNRVPEVVRESLDDAINEAEVFKGDNKSDVKRWIYSLIETINDIPHISSVDVNVDRVLYTSVITDRV